tara:strand:+ start:316 stop:492 length:177 start_codon:yes stop_codon:yes gene_type:complete
MNAKMSSKMKMYEKSSYDKEVKGVKEGSKKDMSMDKKQMASMPKRGQRTATNMATRKK